MSYQNVGIEKTDLSFRKMHAIRWTLEKVSKVPLDTKVIGPDLCLAPGFEVNISFKKSLNLLYVYLCNKSDAEIKIQRTLLVLSDCNYQKLHAERDPRIVSLEKGIDVDMIRAVSDRNIYDTLINDTLLIDICVSMKEIERKEMENSLVFDFGRKLRDDFKTMLENPVNSDVCLQVGDERILAHWSVLCSRSPYFKRMFDSQMQERVQNSVTITDISVSTLKHIVDFLYTASCFEDNKGVNIEQLLDLYSAADKYELLDLRASCARNIINSATFENVGHIFLLGHRHNDKDLKEQAMRFIQLNSDAVFQTDGWKKFESIEPLAAEIFRFSSKKN